MMRPLLFTLRPPRNPLLRAVIALAGLALLGFFTLFGLFAAVAVMAALGLRRAWRHLSGNAPARARRHDQDVIDGEFSVIEKPRAPLPRQ